MRPRRNGRYNADDIFKCIFLKENVWIPTKISLKFVSKGPINNIPALVQIMAWRRPDDKPLSEPMMVCLLTHICVTRPQWVKAQNWAHFLVSETAPWCYMGQKDTVPLQYITDVTLTWTKKAVLPQRTLDVAWASRTWCHHREYLMLHGPGGNVAITGRIWFYMSQGQGPPQGTHT